MIDEKQRVGWEYAVFVIHQIVQHPAPDLQNNSTVFYFTDILLSKIPTLDMCVYIYVCFRGRFFIFNQFLHEKSWTNKFFSYLVVAVQLGLVEHGGGPLHDLRVHSILLTQQFHVPTVDHLRHALKDRLLQTAAHRPCKKIVQV